MSTVLADVWPQARGVVPRSTTSVPVAPRAHVARPALTTQLVEALASPLTLVVAPAGYGKSTAVAEATRHLDLPVAWATLDGDDDDPARAWHHVLAAVTRAGFGEPGAGTMVTARQLEAVATNLLIVIDDPVGALGGGAGSLLGSVIDWMPEPVRLCVVARDVPDMSLARRRVTGGVREFGADDLRFRRQDVADHLNHGWRLGLDDHVVSRITDETEGWPAAVELVAHHLAGDRTPATSRALVRHVLDFVASEVLAVLAPADQRLLQATAALEVLTPALAVAATGSRRAGDHLRGLARRGVLVPLDASGARFRHQRVVRGVLLAAGGGEGASSPQQQGLRRVAHHLAERGQWHDAVRHGLAAGDLDALGPWLDSGLDALVGVDGGALVRAATARIPRHQLRHHGPVVEAALDAHLLAGDRDGIEHLLARLDEPSPVDADDEDRLTSVAHAHLARLRGAPPPLPAPDTPPWWHVAGVARGAEGRHDEAGRLLQQAVRAAVESGSTLRELAVVADLAWERAAAGRLGEADLLVRRSRRLTEAAGLDEIPVPARLARAMMGLDRGRTDLATAFVRSCLSSLADTGDLASWVEAQLLAGRVHTRRGDLRAAEGVLDTIHARLAEEAPGGPLAARVARAEAGLRLALGDVDSLPRIVPDLLVPVPLGELSPEDRLLLARLHIRRADPRRATVFASQMETTGAGPRLLIEAAQVEASAARMLGDAVGHHRARRRSLGLARSEGLLTASPGRPPRAPDPRGPSRADQWGPSAEPDPDVPLPSDPPLTSREVHVLRRLPSRLSNSEIASEMYVSVNTIKSHLKSLYRKLDVASRRDAIARGQELGLL